MAHPQDPATKNDIDDLENRFKDTEMAIGLILRSLSKKLDLNPIFEEALQEAERLGTRKRVPRIITQIRDSVEKAEERKAKLESHSARITQIDDDPYINC